MKAVSRMVLKSRVISYIATSRRVETFLGYVLLHSYMGNMGLDLWELLRLLQ